MGIMYSGTIFSRDKVVLYPSDGPLKMTTQGIVCDSTDDRGKILEAAGNLHFSANRVISTCERYNPRTLYGTNKLLDAIDRLKVASDHFNRIITGLHQ